LRSVFVFYGMLTAWLTHWVLYHARCFSMIQDAAGVNFKAVCAHLLLLWNAALPRAA